MKNLGQCQTEGCTEEARYALYKFHDGSKEWLYVCKLHEEIIGKENIEGVKNELSKKKPDKEDKDEKA